MLSPEADRARRLRNTMTQTEWRLWLRIRGRQLGFKFRRQVPIGPYVADFACLTTRIVVEVDGDTHQDAYDTHRDRWLESRGWRVLRFSVAEIDQYLDAVAEEIYMNLSMTEAPSRLPSGDDRT